MTFRFDLNSWLIGTLTGIAFCMLMFAWLMGDTMIEYAKLQKQYTDSFYYCDELLAGMGACTDILKDCTDKLVSCDLPERAL